MTSTVSRMPDLVTAVESTFMLGSRCLDNACVGVTTTFVLDNSVLQSPLQLLIGRSTHFKEILSIVATACPKDGIVQRCYAPGATTDRTSTWDNH